MTKKTSHISCKFLLIAITFWSSYSCIPYKKTILLNERIHGDADTSFANTKEYKIQPGDILNITVHAPDPNSVVIFNRDVGISNGSQTNEASLYMNGYTVSDSGTVTMPLVGPVMIENKTLEEASSILKDTLSAYYNHVEVDMKILNFYVTVLGEVHNPGTFPIYNSSLNILQAIGNGASLTEYANLTQVQIIRDNDGKKKIEILDLTDPNIIKSEFFILQPNDVIIVRHFKAKLLKPNTTLISISLSVLTFILLLNNSLSR